MARPLAATLKTKFEPDDLEDVKGLGLGGFRAAVVAAMEDDEVDLYLPTAEEWFKGLASPGRAGPEWSG